MKIPLRVEIILCCQDEFTIGVGANHIPVVRSVFGELLLNICRGGRACARRHILASQRHSKHGGPFVAGDGSSSCSYVRSGARPSQSGFFLNGRRDSSQPIAPCPSNRRALADS
jgi:hypothetical protein